MGIEEIREAVLSNARKEASRIVEKAQKRTDSLLAVKKEEIAREIERSYQARTAAIDDEFSRKLIQFKGIANKQILEKRNLLLRSLFQKAMEEILNLPDDEYGVLMRRLVERSSGGSGGKLRVHKGEQQRFARVLSDVNKARDPQTKIVLDETGLLHQPGGFVFIGEDYEVDQTLGTILKDIEVEIMPVIARELFAG
jgi:vacuolar-type H+-ATPase subunit E/Vma4